ncbi:MAG: NAD-dependent epimerase/dehydratase family protein, partial [Chloroflexota bacterium]
ARAVSMSKVLVTGGSGFVGGHVVERLALKRHQALIMDLNPPFMYEVPEGSRYVRCDTRDGYSVKKHIDDFGGVDAIIHLAGVLGTSWLLDREEYAVEHNVNGALPVLRIARDLDVKIVAPMVANSWRNPYTITKKAAGEFMRMFVQEYGIKGTLVRETHVYGPRQPIDERQKIIPTLVGCALLGQPMPLFMKGEQAVDLVYAQDTAESIIRLALTPDAMVGEEAEFATGRLIKVKDVAQMILDITGSESELMFLGRRPGQTGEDDPYKDLNRIFREVGDWPITPVEEGLRNTIEWYQQHFWEAGGSVLARTDEIAGVR